MALTCGVPSLVFLMISGFHVLSPSSESTSLSEPLEAVYLLALVLPPIWAATRRPSGSLLCDVARIPLAAAMGVHLHVAFTHLLRQPMGYEPTFSSEWLSPHSPLRRHAVLEFVVSLFAVAALLGILAAVSGPLWRSFSRRMRPNSRGVDWSP